jgi:Flp pilus assembly protein TadG
LTNPPIAPRQRSADRRRRLSALLGDRNASVAVVTGLSMTLLIGVVGLGVDVGVWYKVRRDMQRAADSAAVAAALNGSSTYQSEARAVTARSGFTDAVNGVSVSAASGQTCPDGSIACYRVTISGPAPAYFATTVGVTGTTISASALAEQQPPLCILGLNATDGGSVDMNGNSQLRGPACALQANSTSASGLSQEGQPQATLKKIMISGGYTGNGYSVAPLTDQPPISDPYAPSLGTQFPPYSSCSNTKGLQVNTDTTLSPGTYCGGIHVFSSANVTLLPGIYVMNGGPLWIDGNSTVTGTEVMIAFTGDGATLQLWGNSTLSLTSPTSGTYQNVQFFEDPAQQIGSKALYFSVGGGNGNDTSKLSTDGLIYVPQLNVWNYGTTTMSLNSPSMSLVCEKLWNQGNATINVTHNNGRNLLLNPGPSAGLTTAGLVQ